MRLLREPLLHFAVLGALLWGMSLYFQAHPRRPVLVITEAHLAQIREHYRRQFGTAPTPAQLDALVETDITEELQYRAALQLGLDRNDEIVRRRLVQKYEFLQQDLGAPEAPSDTQLRTWFEQQQAHYRQPERVTFTHVYFSPDQRGESGAKEAAQTLALALNQRHTIRAPESGDRFPGPAGLVSASSTELGRVFGQEGLAADIFYQQPGHWSPPLHSGYGWHTVYVVSHVPGGPADFAEVRDRVVADYAEAQRAERNAAALAKLRSQYQVVRE